MKRWIAWLWVGFVFPAMACEPDLQEGFGEWKHQNQSGFQATAFVRTALSPGVDSSASLAAALVEAKNLLLKKVPSTLKSNAKAMAGIVVLQQCIRDQKAWAQVWVGQDSAQGAMTLKQLMQQSLQQNPTPQPLPEASN